MKNQALVWRKSFNYAQVSIIGDRSLEFSGSFSGIGEAPMDRANGVISSIGFLEYSLPYGVRYLSDINTDNYSSVDLLVESIGEVG